MTATPPFGHSVVGDYEVTTYVHTPFDGSAPYVVVEIDGDGPLRVYVNDGLVVDRKAGQ